MALEPLGSRYLLHAMIGQGAMGQVYRASVRGTGEPVAVKVLKPELVTNPDLVVRFFQERRILTSVSSPHVVQIEDLVVEGETVAIVMELVEGSDLRSHLRAAGGSLPPAEAVRLASQLLAGAAAVHAAGVVHRDIKPENSLLDTVGGAQLLKLTDFGIAKLAYGASLTKLTSLIGTPEYMAPEVAEARPATTASDMYSAGIVLYEMLCGRTPFAGGHPLAILRRHVDQPPMPIPGIPGWLWTLIAAMLAKDPAARPASAADVSEELAERERQLEGLPAVLPALATAVAAVNNPPSAAAGPARVHGLANGHGNRSAVAPAGDWELDERSEVPAGGARQPDARSELPATGAESPAQPQAGQQREPAAAGPPSSWTVYPTMGRSQLAWDGAAPKRRNLGFQPRPGGAVLAAAVVLAVLIAGSVGFALSRSHAPIAHPPPVSYSFAPLEYPGGVLLLRSWVLSGSDGSVLTETDVATSQARKPVKVTFGDVIPAAVTTPVRAIHFTPRPDQIIAAKRSAVWILNVPPRHETEVGYRAAVAPDGVSLARLRRMAQTVASLEPSAPGSKAKPVQLASLELAPSPLLLATGASQQLVLTGKLADGKRAPSALAKGAVWTSGNARVAAVSTSGVVTGTGAGTTSVTAQIGSVRASAAVTVSASPAAPRAHPASTKSTGTANSTRVTVVLSAAPVQTTVIPCSGKPVTVTAAVTSTKAATIAYQWLVNGAAAGTAATTSVKAGKAVDLSYSPGITTEGQTYAPTIGLDVTSPAKVSASLPVSYTCESHVSSVTSSACTAPDSACVSFAVAATSTEPVTFTWELFDAAASEGPSTPLTLQGDTSYTETVTLGATSCADGPCAAGTYTVDVTATGSDGVAATATGTVTVADSSSSPSPPASSG